MSLGALSGATRRWLAARRRLLAGEDGFIMVIVMLLIVIGLAAGAAALSETLSARGHATRDARSARALQAADAGIQAELYRANQINLGGLKLTSGLSLPTIFSQLATCPVPQVTGAVTGLQFTVTASLGSPCPTNSLSGISNPGPNEEPVGNHADFQSSFIPGLFNIGDFIQFKPKIVASGVDDNGTTQVSRRVEAILAPVAPFRTLEAANDLTINVPETLGLNLGALTVGAGAMAFNGTAAAGHDFNLTGQCGTCGNTFTAANINLSSGVEQSALDYCHNYNPTHIAVILTAGAINQASCGSPTLVDRAAIQISASKANCAPNTGIVACSTLFGSVYNGSADEIYNTNSSTMISFQPGDYVFCGFQTNGPVSLNPSSTQAVRIFIDSPGSSRCSGFTNHSSTGQPSGFKAMAGNFVATQGVGWNALSGTLSTTHPSQAQVYVAGNGANDGTTVTSTGSTLLSGQSMFLYAPTSNVTVNAAQKCVTVLFTTTCASAGAIAGAYIGYDLTVGATAISEDPGLLNYPLSTTLGPFYVKQYIECAPQYPLPTPDPTSGC